MSEQYCEVVGHGIEHIWCDLVEWVAARVRLAALTSAQCDRFEDCGAGRDQALCAAVLTVHQVLERGGRGGWRRLEELFGHVHGRSAQPQQ